jgi:hypothetical protein
MRMQDQLNSTEAAGWISVVLAKFLPAAIGAAIMVVVDMPKSRRDGFARFFVAFAASYLFGDVLFDFLQSTAALSFLKPGRHQTAVDGFVGAVGYFVASGVAVWLRGFKRSPLESLLGAWKALKP